MTKALKKYRYIKKNGYELFQVFSYVFIYQNVNYCVEMTNIYNNVIQFDFRKIMLYSRINFEHSRPEIKVFIKLNMYY